MARTTHRSSKGTKLYAVRGKDGQFEDIQTYKRAHGQDVKRVSMAETAAKKAAAKKAAKTSPAKKAVAKKAPAKKKAAAKKK
jgi:topoisomerase IA-like protein